MIRGRRKQTHPRKKPVFYAALANPVAMPAPKKKATPPKSLRTADKLARLGLSSDMALVLHLPMRYEDETQVLSIRDAGMRHGLPVQVEAVVTDCDVQYRPRRQLVVKITDDTGL